MANPTSPKSTGSIPSGQSGSSFTNLNSPESSESRPGQSQSQSQNQSQNPSPGASTLRDNIRDASERFSSNEIGSRAQDVWDDATEMASEFYGQASKWLDGNYGKAVGAVAVVAAVGLFGYYLGRSSRYSMPELREF